jgi:hypothetical protein
VFVRHKFFHASLIFEYKVGTYPSGGAPLNSPTQMLNFLSMANTVAYFAAASVTEKKSFIILATGGGW